MAWNRSASVCRLRENFVLRGLELRLCGSQRAALRLDLRAQAARQIVQPREVDDDNQNAQQNGEKLQ